MGCLQFLSGLSSDALSLFSVRFDEAELQLVVQNMSLEEVLLPVIAFEDFRQVGFWPV